MAEHEQWVGRIQWSRQSVEDGTFRQQATLLAHRGRRRMQLWLPGWYQRRAQAPPESLTHALRHTLILPHQLAMPELLLAPLLAGKDSDDSASLTPTAVRALGVLYDTFAELAPRAHLVPLLRCAGWTEGTPGLVSNRSAR